MAEHQIHKTDNRSIFGFGLRYTAAVSFLFFFLRRFFRADFHLHQITHLLLVQVAAVIDLVNQVQNLFFRSNEGLDRPFQFERNRVNRNHIQRISHRQFNAVGAFPNSGRAEPFGQVFRNASGHIHLNRRQIVQRNKLNMKKLTEGLSGLSIRQHTHLYQHLS